MFWRLKFALVNQYHWSLQDICCDLISVSVYRPKIRANECSHVATFRVSCKEHGAVMGFSYFSFELLNGFLKNSFKEHERAGIAYIIIVELQ